MSSDVSIDEFSTSLLEEAKRFLEKADAVEGPARDAFLHASLLLIFSAFEAHLNAIMDEISLSPSLSLTDRAIFEEREIELDAGEFSLGSQRLYSISDRVEFLLVRFGGTAVDKQAAWWGGIKQAIALRNSLTHPKNVPQITFEDVKRAIENVVECLDRVYRAVYKRPYPSKNRGVTSMLDF